MKECKEDEQERKGELRVEQDKRLNKMECCGGESGQERKENYGESKIMDKIKWVNEGMSVGFRRRGSGWESKENQGENMTRRKKKIA